MRIESYILIVIWVAGLLFLVLLSRWIKKWYDSDRAFKDKVTAYMRQKREGDPES